MTRTQRLQSARSWLNSYTGKNFVRRYKKYFGVDEVCALLELRELGEKVDNKRIERARISAQKRREPGAANSGFHHYFVAGHTSGGFAYGITWEQAEADGLLKN